MQQKVAVRPRTRANPVRRSRFPVTGRRALLYVVVVFSPKRYSVNINKRKDDDIIATPATTDENFIEIYNNSYPPLHTVLLPPPRLASLNRSS